MSTEYLTVHKGNATGSGRSQRLPRPFTRIERRMIEVYVDQSAADLTAALPRHQNQPRQQRLIQEAIERKRRPASG